MTTNSDFPQDMNSGDHLVAAQFYANDFGLAVVPIHWIVDGRCSCGNADCSSPGKHPIAGLAPHGVLDATTDPNVIGQWFDKYPDANVGVATGELSGFFAVDVDKKSGGLETWADWQDINGPASTLSTLTGGGGNHYLFKTGGQKFKNSVSKVGPGIDIRGDGGLIVFPPSRHVSGDVYEFEADPMPGAIAAAPDWLLAKIRHSEKQPSDQIPAPGGMRIQEGQRNDYLTRMGGAARQKGASETGISALLQAQNDEFEQPLSEQEVAGIAKSISRYSPTAGPLPEPLAATYLDDDDFEVVATHTLANGKLLVIGAREIRKEKSGVHANVEVRCNGVPLGFNTFNVGRIRDRHDLSRHCHGRLPEPLKTDFAKENLESYVDEFCRRVYSNSLKNLAPAPLGGDPDIPITMICGDYIVKGGGTIMFAPPGWGKSFTALAMAISVDAGNHKIWGVKKSRVLYVNLERSKESIQRRIGQCNVALGEHKNRPLHALNTRGKSLEAVKDVIRRYIQQESIEVLVLDSISRSGQGSLVSDEETNLTIDLLNNLCPTWLAIGHTPRADSTHVFGSIHFEAGADLMVSLTSQVAENRMGVGLKVTKANDTPKPPTGLFALEFGPYGLTGIRKAKTGEFADMDAAPTITSQLVNYILENGGKTTATIAADELGLNRSDVSTALNKSNRFVKLEKDGKSQFFGVKVSANP